MDFHVIRVHCSSQKYFYMRLQSLSLFNIDFFLQAVSLRQFVVTGIFFGVSLWPMLALVCGQFYFTIALQKRRFFFHAFFIVPINGKFSKSFKINNNAKIMHDN